MPFVPEEQHGKLVDLRADGVRRRTEAGERAIAPFRALADADRRHGSADALPGDLPAGRGGLPPGRGRRARCSSTRSTARRRRRSSTTSRPRRRRCAWRSSGCSAARWRACRSTPPRSPTATSRIMVNVAALYEGPDEAATHEAWVAGFAGALRQGDAGRVRQLPRRRGRGAGPRGLPGTDLGPAQGDQGPLRPDQPLPAQPEHPARHRGFVEDGRGRGACGAAPRS